MAICGVGVNGIDSNKSCPNVRTGLSLLLFMFVRLGALGGGATGKKKTFLRNIYSKFI